jgi:hypothetical protein
MFWELIATFCAGLGAAGIALFARSVSKKKLPQWLVPVFAGVGMLGFQVYSEYTWFSHQKSLLPDGVEVVKKIEESSPWRPWSFVKPQVVRFVAVRVGEGAVNQVNPDLVLAEVYLFERRKLAKRVHQVFHCGQNARAEFSENLEIPSFGEPLNEQWFSLPEDDPLLVEACRAAGLVKD